MLDIRYRAQLLQIVINRPGSRNRLRGLFLLLPTNRAKRHGCLIHELMMVRH